MQNGEYIVKNAVYGYQKNDLGKWEHDPEAAKVCREIFQLAIDGLSTSQIRDRLFEARYPTPKEYLDMKRGKDVAPRCIWPTKSIYKMLTNEQYTGSYVVGKREQKCIASKIALHTDKSEWIVIPDSHPPIVGKEDFALIQDMLRFPKELSPTKPVQSDRSKRLRPCIESGERKSTNVPYGYRKTQDGAWEVDIVSSAVVYEIYEMASQGLSSQAICDRLAESKYPTMLEYYKMARGHDLQPTCHWKPFAVIGILKDEQYVGTYVAGKGFKDSGGKAYIAPKSEWIRISDKHPAIINKELFDTVQEIMAANKRKNLSRREYLLQGKVSCGCCGYALSYSYGRSFPQYCCTHTRADKSAGCHKMKVDAGDLEEAVMTVIKRQAEIVLGLSDLSGYCEIKPDEHRILDCEKQIQQCLERQQRYFEQFISGEIGHGAFHEFKDECTAQIGKLNRQIAILKQAERDKAENMRVEAYAKEALSDASRPLDIVNALVERVLVFPGDRLEVVWKFVDFGFVA